MTVKTRTHLGIWALAVTAFAIGVAEFIVVGVLPAIAQYFGEPLSRVGSLVGLYAFALAIGTPFVVLGLAKLPRKPVLLTLISIFLIGNILSALATSYSLLLMGRVLTAIAHGSFFAIGATVAAKLAPKGHASQAIALMFAGLTVAMVVGVPLGSWIGNAWGWQIPFYAVVVLAALALCVTYFWVPALEKPVGTAVRGQLKALFVPQIWTMMCVTILGFGASFAAFTFITPILTDITGFSVQAASLLLVIFGVATLAGNLLGGHLAMRWGWEATLQRMLFALFIVLAVFACILHQQLAVMILLFVWGVMAFGMSPGFQAGMLATAERYTPYAVDFASALNISAFNLGITLGETVGSAMVKHDYMAYTPWAGVVLTLLAQIPLWYLSKQKKQA